MKYSFDTSAFIEAWVRHYPHDIFPVVWEHLDGLIRHDHLKAIDEVKRELEEHGDELYDWVKRRKRMFCPLDADVQRRVVRIQRQFPSLVKIDKTRPDADPFVIALAQEHNQTVVTYEVSKPSKPRMPDVCQKLSIPCITLVELFRREGWQFHAS
jgi:hypothetical protein